MNSMKSHQHGTPKRNIYFYVFNIEPKLLIGVFLTWPKGVNRMLPWSEIRTVPSNRQPKYSCPPFVTHAPRYSPFLTVHNQNWRHGSSLLLAFMGGYFSARSMLHLANICRPLIYRPSINRISLERVLGIRDGLTDSCLSSPLFEVANHCLTTQRFTNLCGGPKPAACWPRWSLHSEI